MLTACQRFEGEQRSAKYASIVEESFVRQAAAERLPIEDVKARQEVVTFESSRKTCIILVRSKIAGSQRCFLKTADGWLVVSEEIATTH